MPILWPRRLSIAAITGTPRNLRYFHSIPLSFSPKCSVLQAPGSIKDEAKLRLWLTGYEAEAIKVKMI